MATKTLYFNGATSYSVTSGSVNINLYDYTLFELIVNFGEISSSSRYSCMFSKNDINVGAHIIFKGATCLFRPIEYSNNKLTFHHSNNYMINRIIGYK